MTRRAGNRIKDRPEYETKPKPLTSLGDTTVKSVVAEMTKSNYGSIVITDGERKVIGMVTERDIMTRVVNEGRDPEKTKLSDIMTSNPRAASEDDDLLEWLRIMSNERFRRLPIVNDKGEVVSIFTQGDFVSYTWPDLIYQGKEITRATISKNFNLFMMLGSLIVCGIALLALLRTF